MAKVVSCPACSEPIDVPTCSSCGAELHLVAADHIGVDEAQSLADQDQTESDHDQTGSDRDQASSDSDQRSADEDQHAADDDLAAGGDPDSHRHSAKARDRTTHARAAVSDLRDESAHERFSTAEARDHGAIARDREAEERTARARLEDGKGGVDATSEDILLRAERYRIQAAADRARAAEDRARAASDRKEAARERAEALQKHQESEDTLKLATTDELSGAWTRKFGLEEVSRELERAHRTGARLVIAFIDVDGLKEVNDTEGHLAGDALIKLVGETVRASVRPYDVTVRFGGDEFICAMPNIKVAEAGARFTKIAAGLKAINAEHSISFGLAEAAPVDELEELIARADANLLEARRTRSASAGRTSHAGTS